MAFNRDCVLGLIFNTKLLENTDIYQKSIFATMIIFIWITDLSLYGNWTRKILTVCPTLLYSSLKWNVCQCYVMAVRFVHLTKQRLGPWNMSLRAVLVKFFRLDLIISLLYHMDMFNCLPVADAIARRKSNFVLKFSTSDNSLCQICYSVAPIVSWWTLTAVLLCRNLDGLLYMYLV